MSKKQPNIVLVQLFAKSDDYPYVAELRFGVDRQRHYFGDNHSREAFVNGVRAVAKGLDLRVDERNARALPADRVRVRVKKKESCP